jgi:hypothetical protein
VIDPVEHWQRKLAERVGMDDDERMRLQQRLLAYCARHGVDPVTLLGTWREHLALTVRRRPGATEAPDVAVESFLVHNGVNVFGDIVCVPGAPEDLAAQGDRFVRRVP